MIKLIIFDWDDVITIGSKEGYFACYRKAINSVGVYLSPEEEYRRILLKWGKHYREEIKELLIEYPELVEKATAVYEKEFWGVTFISNLKMIKGTNELLIKLSKKYKLAVVTGNELKMVKDKVMPKFKIPNVFSEILSSCDISDPEKMKPHPYMTNLIMQKLQVNPNETILVGDAIGDVKMALSANVTPVVVLTGQLNKGKSEELGVKHIIENFTQLEKVLDDIKK